MIPNGLINIKRSRLPRLFAVVKAIRNDNHNLGNLANWQKLPDEQLKVKLSTYFSMQGFKEADLRLIEREVNKIIIPWKEIGSLSAIVLLVFTSIMYFRFTQLHRVYAIGNNVPIYASDKLKAEGKSLKRLNIYGKVADGTEEKTAFSMIMKRAAGKAFAVSPDNFFSWLLDSDTDLYVSDSEVVVNKPTYEDYKKLFKLIKDTRNFSSLSADMRNAIYSLVQTPQYRGSVVYNGLSGKDVNQGFSAFEIVPNGDNPWLFIVLQTSSGQFKNLNIQMKGSTYSNVTEMLYRGVSIDKPLVWKPSLHPVPMMYARDASGTQYQSPAPPYSSF